MAETTLDSNGLPTVANGPQEAAERLRAVFGERAAMVARKWALGDDPRWARVAELLEQGQA